jgi:alpha-L-rhamnosidase
VPVVGPVVKGFIAPYTDAVPAQITVFVNPTSSQNQIPSGQSAVQLSQTPIAASSDWQRYVLTPAGSTVSPVTAYYVDGQVSNPDGVAGGTGSTRLTYSLGGQAPVLILDYGKEVGGIPQLTVSNVSSPNIVQVAYSETAANMSPIGDGSLT